MTTYRYPWPASALSQEDMARLYEVREAAPERVHITELIARAVRKAYAHNPSPNEMNPHEHQSAA